MAYHVELQFAAKTDTGLLRPHNEDAIAVSAAYGFAALADGMGGYRAGEVASSIAVNTVQVFLEEQLRDVDRPSRTLSARRLSRMLVQVVEYANTAILQAALNEPMYEGMGTTLLIALFHHDKVLVAHVGDSRCYRLRQGELALLTRDHSLLQEQVDAGLIDAEQARFSPNRNLITRAVGVGSDIDVEVHAHATRPGDLYLLCSDGLSDMLSTREIGEILNRSGSDLAGTCDALIQTANENGGRDNISVILANIKSSSPESEGILTRVRGWIG